jgi:hypothetical protein
MKGLDVTPRHIGPSLHIRDDVPRSCIHSPFWCVPARSSKVNGDYEVEYSRRTRHLGEPAADPHAAGSRNARPRVKPSWRQKR